MDNNYFKSIKIFYLFFFLLIVNTWSEITPGNSILTLYNNRFYIEEIYQNCEEVNYKGRLIVPCGGIKNRKLFKSHLNEPFNKWEENEEELINAFYELCTCIRRVKTNKGNLINDDKLVEIIISLFGDTTKLKERTISKAYKLLYDYTHYTQLSKHSNILKKALDNSSISEDKKLTLYLLCDLSEEEKTQFLKREHLPLHFCVRLGDKQAEDSLIKMYDNEKKYQVKRKFVKELIYAGTLRCSKHLILKFNEPVYDITPWGCVTESIRWPIINSLQKHHPNAKVINERLEEFLGLNLPNTHNSELVTKYLAEFKKWAKEEYGVEPEDPDPEPAIFRKTCFPPTHNRKKPRDKK